MLLPQDRTLQQAYRIVAHDARGHIAREFPLETRPHRYNMSSKLPLDTCPTILFSEHRNLSSGQANICTAASWSLFIGLLYLTMHSHRGQFQKPPEFAKDFCIDVASVLVRVTLASAFALNFGTQSN